MLRNYIIIRFTDILSYRYIDINLLRAQQIFIHILFHFWILRETHFNRTVFQEMIVFFKRNQFLMSKFVVLKLSKTFVMQ